MELINRADGGAKRDQEVDVHTGSIGEDEGSRIYRTFGRNNFREALDYFRKCDHADCLRVEPKTSRAEVRDAAYVRPPELRFRQLKRDEGIGVKKVILAFHKDHRLDGISLSELVAKDAANARPDSRQLGYSERFRIFTTRIDVRLAAGVQRQDLKRRSENGGSIAVFFGSVFSFAPTRVQQGKMTRQQVFRSGGCGGIILARAAF